MALSPASREQGFHNRREAGRVLAGELSRFTGCCRGIVLALPRGGVPVGYEVAMALDLPLDVFVVRKLGMPGQEELAMGALASGGVRVLNEGVVSRLPNPRQAIDLVVETEARELERREAEYRQGRSFPDLHEATVILVDDGLATGATMRAAILALKRLQVAQCVVAVPVAAPEVCQELGESVDEVVCAITPPDFGAVGQFYEDFSQTSDEEVRQLLRDAARRFEAL